MNEIRIGAASEEDLPSVLKLMRELANFEGYLSNFAVSLQALEEVYLKESKIGILCAFVDDKVEGILVYFYQPFTYDLTPWIVIKEFYVTKEARNFGLGTKLISSAKHICLRQGCKKMKWEVLTDNKHAQRFYRRHGGKMANDWLIMEMDFA